ncbi:MAG TPA: Imm50 family immunity protein [Microvirga sp.]|nr:Imm50 family immunity protein [Microvirga sp.]
MADEIPSPDVLESVPGGPDLLAWFGHVPRFHDAEIISLHLNRTGPSTLSIHTWEITDTVDSKGFYVLEKQAIVTFTLEEIENLELEGFSHQNVIGGLELNPIKAKTPSLRMPPAQLPGPQPDLYEIILHPCYGLSGSIRAQQVSIALTPSEPAFPR